MPESYGEHVEHVDINTCHPQELEISSISYSTNQPVDSNLQNSNTYPVFIYGLDNHLNTDTNNIAVSPVRIASYIRDYPLGGKTEKNILPLDLLDLWFGI